MEHTCHSFFCKVVNDEYRFFFRYRIGYIIMIITHVMLLIAKYLSTIILTIQHSQEISVSVIVLIILIGIAEIFIIHIVPLICNINPLMIFEYFDKLEHTFHNEPDDTYCFFTCSNNVEPQYVHMYITFFILSIGLTNSIQILFVNCCAFNSLLLIVPQIVFLILGIIFMIILRFCDACREDRDGRKNIENFEKIIPNDGDNCDNGDNDNDNCIFLNNVDNNDNRIFLNNVDNKYFDLH